MKRRMVAGLFMVELPASMVDQKRVVKDISKFALAPAKLYSGLGRPIELFIGGIRTVFGDRRPEFIIVPKQLPELKYSPARRK